MPKVLTPTSLPWLENRTQASRRRGEGMGGEKEHRSGLPPNPTGTSCKPMHARRPSPLTKSRALFMTIGQYTYRSSYPWHQGVLRRKIC